MALEIARAMNSLLGLSGSDQAALVEVIQDYFCEPDPDDEENEEPREDDCGESSNHEGPKPEGKE